MGEGGKRRGGRTGLSLGERGHSKWNRNPDSDSPELRPKNLSLPFRPDNTGKLLSVLPTTGGRPQRLSIGLLTANRTDSEQDAAEPAHASYQDASEAGW